MIKWKTCPLCGRDVSVYGPDDWEPTFYDPDSGGDPVTVSCACGLTFCMCSYDYEETSEVWNKRVDNNNDSSDCSCYHEGHCLGTKEIDPCSCNGDRSKCDFY